MKNLGTTSRIRYSVQSTPSSSLIHLGRWEIFVCRDSRKRRYKVHPIADISTGIEAGHREVLLFRKWLVIVSKSRKHFRR